MLYRNKHHTLPYYFPDLTTYSLDASDEETSKKVAPPPKVIPKKSSKWEGEDEEEQVAVRSSSLSLTN